MERTVIRSISYDSLTSSVCEIEADLLNFTDNVIQLWGSCNGMVCIYPSGTGSGIIFCLLNPATREYRVTRTPTKPLFLCLCGLDYDRQADDYKLIVGDDFDGYRFSSEVQVYSLTSNSWKTIPTIPYTFPYSRVSGVLLNGYLHWLALSENSSKVIVSFDLSDERFKEVQLPEFFWKYDEYLIESLGVSKGCLGLLVNHEVWLMLDYGVEESWTKSYIITHESIVKGLFFSPLIWSFENGKLLFLSSGTLVLYDPEDESAREPNVHNIAFKSGADYFESLVSLHSGTYVGGDGRIEELRES
ncbi:F-box protein CPR1-like [Papaver somniferum]|uniref:F-box protein CPR1-like n=1 Tax=Papaver somniferum TaxID=3469 RepID=UPI000E6FB5F1|nr:F-box protein CPR1-like [Papaver somniferum]